MEICQGSTTENIGIFNEQVFVYEKENLSKQFFCFLLYLMYQFSCNVNILLEYFNLQGSFCYYCISYYIQ